MGMRSDGGNVSGYDTAKLLKAQEQAALVVEVEGPLDQWLIGMTPEVAEANLKHRGMRFRIAQRQGVTDFMMTADHVVTRVNVNLGEDGTVAEVLGRG